MPLLTLPTLVMGPVSSDALVLPRATRVRLVPLARADEFLSALEGRLPAGCVVSARWGRHVRDLLHGLLLEIPAGHFVLGLEDPGHIPGVPPVEDARIVTVAPLPDPGRLDWAALRVAFEGRVARLMGRIEARAFHWLVTRALRSILAERFPGGSPEPEECEVVRSLEDLRARCGASEDVLRRRCREAGVDVVNFIRMWRTALVLHDRLLSDPGRRTPWETVARRAGLAGPSGIRYALSRDLDRGLGEVALDDLARVLAELERIVE
jgi:hypothetical protein